MAECLVPSDRKPGGVLVVARGVPRRFRSMRVGRTRESDEHLVVNEIGLVVRVKRYDDAGENENSGSDAIKLNATPSYLKPDGDDVEVQERWTPTPGCRACESAHGNKHLVRCEARRYEYRLKYGRDPPVTTRGVCHEPETAPEGARPVESEPSPVSDREREPAVSSQATSSASAKTETAHTSQTPVERLRLKGKQHAQNRESPATTRVPSQPMDLSEMSARVRLNMKRSPLESQGDRSKQRRVLEDPDEDEVMIGEVQVNEEVEHPR